MVVGLCTHDMDVPVCQYARFGSAESTPNLMLPLTDASVSCVHDPTTFKYQLINHMESLDAFHAGIAEVRILRANSALPNMAIQF